jgi:hypothetical protein
MKSARTETATISGCLPALRSAGFQPASLLAETTTIFGCLLALWLAGTGFMPSACAQQPQGTAEKPQLAPIYAGGSSQPPVTLPTQGPPGRTATYADGSPAPAPSKMPRINCRLSVHKIGNLQLDDAVTLIENRFITVRWLNTDPKFEPVLKGRLIRLDDAGTAAGKLRKMSGLVLFYAGEMLGRLNESDPIHAYYGYADSGEDRLPTEDFIFRNDGSLSGQITGVNADQLVVRTRAGVINIDIDSVRYIRSPRAFVFTIVGMPSADLGRTQVQDVTFQPTMTQQTLSNQLVAGHRSDDLLDDDSDDDALDIFPKQMPQALGRFRQFQSGNANSGSILPTWP